VGDFKLICWAFETKDCLIFVLQNKICILKIFFRPGGVAEWSSHPPSMQNFQGSNPARVKVILGHNRYITVLLLITYLMCIVNVCI
jgi:hypothetical protein